jgi:hypothetical protein
VVSDVNLFPDSRLKGRVHKLARYPHNRSGHPIAACSQIACLISFWTSGGRVGLIPSHGKLLGSTESCCSTEMSMFVIVSRVMLPMDSYRVR